MEQINNDSSREPIREQVHEAVDETINNTIDNTVHADEARTKNETDHSMFYRHPTDKLAGGVCGGIADYLGWEPAMVRILWVVVTLFTAGFAGLAVYGALWALLPVGTVKEGQVSPPAIALSSRNIVPAAFVLIGLGIIWLLSNIGVLGSLMHLMGFVGIIFWPVLLISIGYLMLREADGEKWSFDNLGSGLGRAKEKAQEQANKFSQGGNGMDDLKSGVGNLRQSIPLKRSREDRVALGVCGGIGEKLGLDANLVRLIWAAVSIASMGLGVFGYLFLAILLPESGAEMQSEVGDEVQQVQIVNGAAS